MGFTPGMWASRKDGRGPWTPLPTYAPGTLDTLFKGQRGQSLAVVLVVLRNLLKDPQVQKLEGQVSIGRVAWHAGLKRRQTGELVRTLVRAGWIIAEGPPPPRPLKYRLHPAVEEEFARVTCPQNGDICAPPAMRQLSPHGRLE